MHVHNPFTDLIDGQGTVAGGNVETVPDAEHSSFDAIDDTPYVTVRERMRRLVNLRALKAEQIASSNPKAASARIIRGNGSNTVEITGHAPGTAVLSAVWVHPTWKADIVEGTLEVDVCRQRTVFLTFHFVDQDMQGNRTALSASTVQNDLIPYMNDVFRAGNIQFKMHLSRRVPPALTRDLDFATPNRDKASRVQIYTTLYRLGLEFDPSPTHVHVWCVKSYGVEDHLGQVVSDTIGHPIFPVPVTVNFKVPDSNVAGGTLPGGKGYGPLIVIEDEPQKSLAYRLAHEVGHSLGLYTNGTHSARTDALMYRADTRQGTKLYKEDYRKIVMRK